MKNKVGWWIFLTIMVLVLTVVLTLELSKPPPPAYPGDDTTANSNPVEAAPVKTVESPYVGHWVIPGESLAMVIQSDGTGFMGGGGSQNNFTWEVDGALIKMIWVKDPSKAGYGRLNADGNFQALESASSSEPKYTFIRQK